MKTGGVILEREDMRIKNELTADDLEVENAAIELLAQYAEAFIELAK